MTRRKKACGHRNPCNCGARRIKRKRTRGTKVRRKSHKARRHVSKKTHREAANPRRLKCGRNRKNPIEVYKTGRMVPEWGARRMPGNIVLPVGQGRSEREVESYVKRAYPRETVITALNPKVSRRKGKKRRRTPSRKR